MRVLKLIVPVERIFFIAVRHQTPLVRTVVRIKQKSDCQITLAGKDSHFVHVFVADPYTLRMDETDFSVDRWISPSGKRKLRQRHSFLASAIIDPRFEEPFAPTSPVDETILADDDHRALVGERI